MDTCDLIRDELVDYADGELAPAAAARVAEHLQGCAACRTELAALERSLGLAQAVWRDRTETCESRPSVAGPARAASLRWRRAGLAGVAALAASLLLAVVASGWWWRTHGPEVDVAQTPSSAEPPATVPISDVTISGSDIEGSDLDVDEIERMLDREELAARLAASAQVLADQPGAEEYAQRSFRYLAEVFPNTAAGKDAARRVVQ